MVNNFLSFFNKFLRKIKILDRYILSEIAGPFLFGMLGFVIIGMVDVTFTLIDLFINNGVPLLIVLKLLIYKIPAIMVLFFPMATLFAVLITLVRLSKDSEITVMRAGGFSLLRIVIPVVLAGIIISGISFVANEKVVPWANQISDSLIQKAVLKKPSLDIIENTFFKESDSRYFYIKKIDQETNEMEHVVIYELTADFPRVITAQKASWNGKEWLLLAGVIHKYSKDGLIAYQGTFDKMIIHIEEEFYNYYKSQKTPMEMNTKELKDKIKNLKKGGVSSESLQVAYHMKYSIPFACLVFAVLGSAFVLLFIRNGKDLWGVIIAVLTALMSVGFYFFVMATFRSLGRGGYISPLLGAWGPNILYGTVAFSLVYVINKRK